MKTSKWKQAILAGQYDEKFSQLYGEEALEAQKARYCHAIEAFEARYGAGRDAELFSVTGRSELSGNHTDHNHGKVLAASVNLDVIAVAAKRDDGVIRIKSEGHEEDIVSLDRIDAPDPTRYGRSSALIAGMANGFSMLGFAIGGFDAYTTSNVPKGSGLSSSAAFEDLVGTLLSHLYNGGRVDRVAIAKLAQRAENLYFGKPCGLMDQVACIMGGIVYIDFADPASPVIETVPFDFSGAGYRLCIVNTGGNHADLTDDYAAVPAEMKAVANACGKEVLRDLDEATVLEKIPDLRKSVGDRAVLRALHFYAENRRVDAQKAALLAGNLAAFFDGVLASGRSSFCYLQNVYTNKNVEEQGLSLALCLSERVLAGKGGAYRVHGGGFAGTIQAFVPDALVEEFRGVMDGVFGEGHCMVLRIRQDGAVKI